MGVNKVIYDGNTLIDLTGDSVTPETLAEGVTAHSASGEKIVGTAKISGVVNLIETALTPNDITTIFNGVGYKDGYYASAAEPFYNTDSAFFCTGLMVIPSSKVFYVKGCTIDTSLSHTRFGLMKENGASINTTTLASWGSGAFTVTELASEYYAIAINYTSNSPYYFYFSASGSGNGVIVATSPIEDTGTTETWTFEMEDGSTVTKEVMIR